MGQNFDPKDFKNIFFNSNSFLGSCKSGGSAWTRTLRSPLPRRRQNLVRIKQFEKLKFEHNLRTSNHWQTIWERQCDENKSSPFFLKVAKLLNLKGFQNSSRSYQIIGLLGKYVAKTFQNSTIWWNWNWNALYKENPF